MLNFIYLEIDDSSVNFFFLFFYCPVWVTDMPYAYSAHKCNYTW